GPGVCSRLLTRPAQSLTAAHAAGLVHGHLQPASFVLTGDGVLQLSGLGEPLWLSENAPTVATEPTPAADLAALGRVAAAWAGGAPARKGARTKAVPDALQEIVRRPESADRADCFAIAAALGAALEQAGPAVPATATAWER